MEDAQRFGVDLSDAPEYLRKEVQGIMIRHTPHEMVSDVIVGEIDVGEKVEKTENPYLPELE